MNATPDIAPLSMLMIFLLLAIPAAISYYLGLRINRQLFVSVIRMTVQLFLVGIYLTYLFDLNSAPVTIAWLTVMISFAALSVVRGSDLNYRFFLLPTAAVLFATTMTILGYFNVFVLRLEDVFEAKFVIAVGGMVLGNAMRGIIIGVTDFYRNLKRNENRYLFSLAQGATVFEASSVCIRKSLVAALRPSIASMATMGIVFLPGMMTGQIIGGSSPLVAIKYQIAIMITILVSTMLSIGLTIMLTMKTAFDDFGLLKNNIFK